MLVAVDEADEGRIDVAAFPTNFPTPVKKTERYPTPPPSISLHFVMRAGGYMCY